MGERGPRPTPSGYRRPNERLDRRNPREPVPSPGPPSAPAWLPEEAKEVWERLAPDLYAAGVLTAWDGEFLAVHCDLAARLHRARELLDGGLLARGRRDGFITNPAWRIYRDALREFIRTSRELGLTPSSRFELRVDPAHRAAEDHESDGEDAED